MTVMPKPTTDMGWGSQYGPWEYTMLNDPAELSNELKRQALPRTMNGADCVTLQPCPDPAHRSQDRYTVVTWDVQGSGQWTCAFLFDGHAGHETADWALQRLPGHVEDALRDALSSSTAKPDPSTISHMLQSTIRAFDDTMTDELVDLFPGGPESIARLSDDEISAVINVGDNAQKVIRCMRGSTVLVSLRDPRDENVWVASLGDCQAILGSTDEEDERWNARLLSSNHNGRNVDEVERIRREHPREPDVVLQARVLGAIAVTRAIGDHLFKLPRIFTDRVFINSKPGFKLATKIDDFLGRNRTPPYLSNIADVQHISLSSLSSSSSTRPPLCLIMCTDGLTDLYEQHGELDTIAQLCVDVVAKKRNGKLRMDGSVEHENSALSLLRDALGGDNVDHVSRMLTVEMVDRWMDDTTVIVQWF